MKLDVGRRKCFPRPATLGSLLRSYPNFVYALDRLSRLQQTRTNRSLRHVRVPRQRAEGFLKDRASVYLASQVGEFVIVYILGHAVMQRHPLASQRRPDY